MWRGWMAVVVMAGWSGAAVAVPCSTRHFYNETANVDVHISMRDATCSLPGQPNSSACTILPHQTAELHWPDHFGGRIMIWDPVYRQNLVLDTSSDSCYINHASDTGPYAINDPVDGDIRRY